ncbi:MAG: hypothetical protein ACT4QA_03765 [Panacagrimonas sp.]
MNDGPLHRLIDAELARRPPVAVTELASILARRAAGDAAAVLYYGSTLRDDSIEGVLDFYILLDRVSAWPGSRLAILANRLLPPNVGYFEGSVSGQVLRAKYAVMSLDQFHAGMSADALDTTLWARFSQPCACAWARSTGDRSAVAAMIRQAVTTAARWAAMLGPERGDALAFWRVLFSRTYDAELRVEKTQRGADLVARDAPRYAQLLPAAWDAAEIVFDAEKDGRLAPHLSPRARLVAARRWALRRRLGKMLNLLRLLKAALTFDGAMDYVVWKVERHAGVRLEVAPWQRRFPLLAAPGIYFRLRRLGVLR